MTTGQIIRWSTAGAVVGVAAVAAVASDEHADALVRAHGETGWVMARSARPWPRGRRSRWSGRMSCS
jgi:hypothetical protein